MVTRRFDLRGAMKKALSRIRGSELTPLRFALSLAVGLWVGCLPLYGVHFFLCAVLTIPLRLNFLVAYAAAHISIPPTLPLLWFAALQVGSVAISGAWLDFGWSDFTLERAMELGTKLFVGSVILGGILALLGGTTAYLVLHLGSARKGGPYGAIKLERAILRTARRYALAPRSVRYYVRSKLLIDPLAEQLWMAFRQMVQPGAVAARLTVLDVGSGRGQYALLLHELDLVKETFGFDHDAAKIGWAEAAAGDLPASFEVRDLRSGPYPACDVLLLLDVLHYLGAADRSLVLRWAAEAIRPGGHVLIRETDLGAGVGAYLAGWLERIGRALGINRGERLDHVSTGNLEATLIQAGFEVLSEDRRGTLDNVLLVARKADRGGAREPRADPNAHVAN